MMILSSTTCKEGQGRWSVDCCLDLGVLSQGFVLQYSLVVRRYNTHEKNVELVEYHVGGTLLHLYIIKYSRLEL